MPPDRQISVSHRYSRDIPQFPTVRPRFPAKNPTTPIPCRLAVPFQPFSSPWPPTRQLGILFSLPSHLLCAYLSAGRTRPGGRGSEPGTSYSTLRFVSPYALFVHGRFPSFPIVSHRARRLSLKSSLFARAFLRSTNAKTAKTEEASVKLEW